MNIALLRAVFDSNHEAPKDREDDPQGSNNQRQQDGGLTTEVVVQTACAADYGIAQYHGCQYGCDVRAEQIGTHTCHVTDVITDVICDGRRIAGVVLRNACFDLSHQVRADVSRLGVDASSNTCEERNRFRSQ